MSLQDVLRRAITRPTRWRFVTSAGGDASAWLLTGSAGEIDVVHRVQPPESGTLRYAAIGGSVSVGLPAGFDISTRGMYSDGRIYAGPAASGSDLRREDFPGFCIMLGISGSAGVWSTGRGVAETVIAFGGSEAARAALMGLLPLGINPLVSVIALPFVTCALWAQFKGLALLVGANRGAQGGLGLSVMQGRMQWRG